MREPLSSDSDPNEHSGSVDGSVSEERGLVATRRHCTHFTTASFNDPYVGSRQRSDQTPEGEGERLRDSKSVLALHSANTERGAVASPKNVSTAPGHSQYERGP